MPGNHLAPLIMEQWLGQQQTVPCQAQSAWNPPPPTVYLVVSIKHLFWSARCGRPLQNSSLLRTQRYRQEQSNMGWGLAGARGTWTWEARKVSPSSHAQQTLKEWGRPGDAGTSCRGIRSEFTCLPPAEPQRGEPMLKDARGRGHSGLGWRGWGFKRV